MASILDIALVTFRSYAERHGYDLVLGAGSSEGRPPAWAKVPLMRSLVEAYDVVLWVDADALMVDLEDDVADLVPPDAYQALVITTDGAPNSGVWFVRSCDRTRSFLRAVWASTDDIHHRCWENFAVASLLGYNMDLNQADKDVGFSAWRDGTFWLPRAWNVYGYEIGTLPRERIHHFAGMPNHYRILAMKRDLGGMVTRVRTSIAWRLLAIRVDR